MGRLICLRLVENIHLAGYAVRDDGTDGCHMCFVAREYSSGGVHTSLMDPC